MKSVIQMIVFDAVLIVAIMTQSVQAQQLNEVESLIADLALTFKNIIKCDIPQSSSNLNFNIKKVSFYIETIESFEFCDIDTRNYLSARDTVSNIWRELMNGRSLISEGERCIASIDNIINKINNLAKVLRDNNFESDHSCNEPADYLAYPYQETDKNPFDYYVAAKGGLILRSDPYIDKNNKILALPWQTLLMHFEDEYGNKLKLGSWYKVIYIPSNENDDSTSIAGWVHSDHLHPTE